MLHLLWRTTSIAFIPVIAGLLISFYVLPEWQKWPHELFHVLIEGSGALIGFGLAFVIIGMVVKKDLGKNYIWLVACFLSMGTLDMAHSLLHPGQTFVWLHSTATFIGGLFAMCIWMSAALSAKFYNKYVMGSILFASILFSVWSILWPELTLPMLDSDDNFTLQAKVLNFSGGMGFFIAWLYFVRQYYQNRQLALCYFSNHFALFGMAGLLFELSGLWDANWWLWHLARVFAYFFLMTHFIIVLYQKNEETLGLMGKVIHDSINEIYIFDKETLLFQDVNLGARKNLKYDLEELKDMTPLDIRPAHTRSAFLEQLKPLKSGKKQLAGFTTIHQRKDGSIYPVKVNLQLLNDQSPVFIAIVLDITDYEQAERELFTQSVIITNMTEGAFLVRQSDEKIVYTNPSFNQLFGYQENELLGQHISVLNEPSDLTSNKASNIIAQLPANDKWQGELLNIKKDGTPFWCSTNVSAFNHPEHGDVWIFVNADITEKKIIDEQILHDAQYDTLTNLANRSLVLDRLAQFINKAKRTDEKIAVLFLDLDDFKKVNDSLGHESGDKLLVQAAKRLTNTVRSVDMVARLGGDEFIILLAGLKCTSDAQVITGHLLDQFRYAFNIDERELILTASIGLAIYPMDGYTASTLLKNADSAMYHAKKQGRNTYCYFTEKMNQAVSRRLLLEEQMHGALNRNEFEVYYQPKIAINNGNIIGAEALLRWKNPKLGEVSPNEFIPIAEQTGVIISIGEYVMKQALTQTAEWQKHKADFFIAINLSPRQFRDPELVNVIQRNINASAVLAKYIILEITEGVLMSGHRYINDTLMALCKMDLTIAMDDFGTGYSSLSYLRRFPFNILKIDQSFVRDIVDDPQDRELVNAAIAMSQALKLKVVAEGVETEQQLSYLKEMGCDYAQGYLFSKPVAANSFTQLLKTENIT